MIKSSLHILFVARRHSGPFEISPFIESQGRSLSKIGLKVSYFYINGKGLLPYFKNVVKLHKFLKNTTPDIIHAHYSLCGLTCVLAHPAIPIVLSYMGSDLLGEYITKDKISFRSKIVRIISIQIQPYIQSIISKSQNIDSYISEKHKKYIIPNGVEISKNENTDQILLKRELKLNPERKYVLFMSNPADAWKNHQLAKTATEAFINRNIELISPYPVEPTLVKKYLIASDVLISTSFMEGSPNIIKEAMALNRPVVSTDVGDVRSLFGNEKGYFITSFEIRDVIEKLETAIAFSTQNKNTNGGKRISELKLDSESVARRLESVYKETLLAF